MRDRFSASMITVAIATVAASVISVPTMRASAQAPAASGAMPAAAPLKTPWGDPDLQGIWTDEFDTPLQRPAKYARIIMRVALGARRERPPSWQAREPATA